MALVADGSGSACSDRFQAEPAAGLVEHCGGAGRAAAGDPDVAYTKERVEVAGSPRGLHLNVRSCGLAHEREVFKRRAARSVAGGRLDPIGAGFRADVAQPDLLVVVEVGVLEDDLGLLAGSVRFADETANLIRDVIPVAAQRLADVDH